MKIARDGLARQMHDRYGYTKSSAEELIDDFIDVIKYNYSQGNEVILNGFGRFTVNYRKARRNVNPVTKEDLIVPARCLPKFFPSPKLKEIVAEWAEGDPEGVDVYIERNEKIAANGRGLPRK